MINSVGNSVENSIGFFGRVIELSPWILASIIQLRGTSTMHARFQVAV